MLESIDVCMCKLCAVESPVMFPGVATVGAGTVRTLYKHTETEHTHLRSVYSQTRYTASITLYTVTNK